MSVEFWSKIVKQHWQLDTEVKPLVGEFDLNFRLSSPKGDYILKVMRQDCGQDFMDMQCDILTHLDGKFDLVPTLVKTAKNQNYVMISDQSGAQRFAYIISVIKGGLYVQSIAKPLNLAIEIGTNLAKLDIAMDGFNHPLLSQDMKWDLSNANWIKDDYYALFPKNRQQLIAQIINDYEQLDLDSLPKQAIHNDLNDYNILILKSSGGQQNLSGFIDFGDMIAAPKICNIAICAAYLMLDVDKPLDYLAALVAAYHQHSSLSEREIEIIWQLSLMRLAVSVTNSALMQKDDPDDDYIIVSQAPAWRMLEKSAQYSNNFVSKKLLQACGYRIDGETKQLNAWLVKNINDFAPMFGCDLSTAPILDWSIAGKHAATNAKIPDMHELQLGVDAITPIGKPSLGGYSEPRLVYASNAFIEGDHQASDRRTVHIAIDVFLPAGSPLYAPYDAVVHSASIQNAAFDYGGLVTLKHVTDDGQVFYTLYGHLAWDDVKALKVGHSINKGDAFVKLGDYNQNGTWPPHVHFQLGFEDLHGKDWPGVVSPDDLSVWQEIYPDPAPLLNLTLGHVTRKVADRDAEHKRRKAWSGKNLNLTYKQPLLLIRGYECQLYDEWGRTYLDAFNNVPHVGHANPRIASVAFRQMQMLNTNTRYLHQAQSDYAEAMLAKMPKHIDCIFFLNSASEANELAMRMAREYTGAKHTIVTKAGYHGNTLTAIDLSDYKFSAKGGRGAKDWVHVAPIPDGYKGEFKNTDPEAGLKYAQYTKDIIDGLTKKGEKLAAFITESFPSVGGQIIPPNGYLKAVFDYTRAAGGIAIADEVQTGMGRLGKYFWGFEQQDATPDMIILGKPIGNGHPIGILATTREIADRFANGMEFFSTFGGSTLSCTVGHEVLKIVDEENLQQNAETIGNHLMTALKDMQKTTPSIGDVRGLGLFIGIEMIAPDGSPAKNRANYIANRMAEKRILIGTDGPHGNVLKLRAPLIFNQADADHLLKHIKLIFAEQQDLVW